LIRDDRGTDQVNKAAKAARPIERAFTRTDQVLQMAATVLFAATLATLLLLGIRGANQLQSASSALQVAAQLSAQPQLINAELTLIQRGLETTTYVGGSLGTLEALRAGTSQTLDELRKQLQAAGLGGDADIRAALDAVSSRWQLLDQRLAAVRNRHGVELYVDTPAGSQLSADGRATKAAVDSLLATQTQNLQLLNQGVTRLGAVLRESVDDSGFALRGLLLAGAAVAGALLALMLYFAWRSRQAARLALAARRQVTNILNTVREGLFLVDRDLHLGQTYSDSLCELLRLEAPAGLHIEDMLKPLVDGKTLTAALKFLGLLWKDKVHEELIESVNPLSQIEVSFGNARGGVDVRYLAFSFRRVRDSERGADRSADYILGVVADVTDRVLLARELENVKADSDSQATLQLQLLRLEGEPLRTFLASADIALRKSNAVLTGSGIEQEDLKKKLHGVFRELHAIKGEAAALSLGTFVQRIHGIEDALTALRGRSQLSGNDFLPVVVRLDELINHLAQIRSMQERLATLRGLSRPAAPGDEDAEDDASHRDTTVLPGRVVPGTHAPAGPSGAAAGPESRGGGTRPNPLTELLRNLTQEVGRAQGHAARLAARGLEDVPPQYAATVKDICIQMIRNCIAHGIESPEQRRALGKAEEGTVQISFAAEGVEEYVLTVEDDGRGLAYEQIVDKALRLGLISPQQAMTLERAAVYRLIFQPGFSTTEEVSEHAGRGVGLDAVSSRVREQGGRIGVSTAAGRYTRFRVLLPRVGEAPQTANTAA
jgi:two-component system, chemotaxis family, sensor kinase CheA